MPLPNSSSLSRSKKPKKKPYQWKRKPKKNAAEYAAWGEQHTHCQCCGIEQEHAARARFPGLSTHHITKAGRVHNPTNLIRMCARCHDLAENLDTPVWLTDGTKWYYPKLTTAHVMWLKCDREPREWDEVVMRKLHMRPLPDLEPPPAVFLAEYHARQGSVAPAIVERVLREFPGTMYDLLTAKMQPK